MQQKSKNHPEQMGIGDGLAFSLDDPIGKACALIESAQGGLCCLIESMRGGKPR